MPAQPAFPFQSYPSSTPDPTVTIRNADWEATIFFRFYGPGYDQTSAYWTLPKREVFVLPGQTTELTLPRGTYYVEGGPLTSLGQLSTGIAVFQRFTRYESSWVVVTTPKYLPPSSIYMGDVDAPRF